MRLLATLMLLSFPACGAMRVYEGPQLPPNEVALIESAEHSLLFVFSLDTVDLLAVDGEELGLFTDTAEVKPGTHTVTATRGSGTGAKNRVDLVLDAKAGHTYEIDAKDVSWTPRVVAFWIVDAKTKAVVAGTKPPDHDAAAASTNATNSPTETSEAAPVAASAAAAASPETARPTPSDPLTPAPSLVPPPIEVEEELWRGTRRAAIEGTESFMTVRVRPVLGGSGRIEEIEVTRTGGNAYRGLFVEAYDEAESRWVRQYVNSTTGAFVRMDGVDGSRAVWISGAPDRAHRSKLELSWIAPDRWRRVQSVSDDGGRTFRILFTDELVRATR